MMNGSNDSYKTLLLQFPPRPIHSEQQYYEAQERIDALIDKGELTADEEDYLTLLGMVVEAYEEATEREEEYELRGVTLIEALLDEHNLRQKDLVPIFKTESIVSAVLNGHRRLTVEHIDRLAQFFQLPHSLFFEATPPEDMDTATAEVATPFS